MLTDVDVWAPANFAATPFPKPPVRGACFLTGAIARVRPGITIAQAGERLAGQGLRAAYSNDYPTHAGWTPRLVPLQDDLVGSVNVAVAAVAAYLPTYRASRIEPMAALGR